MATNIKGYTGSVKVGIDTMGNAKAWSLDITQETEDVTTLGSNGWKESIGLLKTWSGSITAIFDTSGVVEGALQASLTGDPALTLELTAGDGSGTYDVYTGSANITSQSITNDVNSILEVSFDFEGTGTLTIA